MSLLSFLKDVLFPRPSFGVDNLATSKTLNKDNRGKGNHSPILNNECLAKQKPIELMDGGGRPLLTLICNDENLQLTIHKPIDLTIDGELNFLCNGDILIDSFKSQLHLNSRLAKQIRDLPESIQFREEQAKKIAELEGRQCEILLENKE